MTEAMGNLMIDRAQRSAIAVPALVIVGTADGLLDNSRQLVGWWPAARLVELPDANHTNIMRRPELLPRIRELLVVTR